MQTQDGFLVQLLICTQQFIKTSRWLACLKWFGEKKMRGKPWSIEEERHLRQLIKEGKGFSEVAQIMGKSRVSIKNKLYNLGLTLKDNTQPQMALVVSSSPSPSTKLSIAAPSLPADVSTITESSLELKSTGPLPSVEQKLRVLDAALVALERPNLAAVEISRLHEIIQGVKVYQPLFADYVNYRSLESEVLELRKQLAAERNKS
jgi:hypothetical protein